MAGHVALTELCGAADECDNREIIIGRYKLLDTARSSGPASEKEGHDEYCVVQNSGGGEVSCVITLMIVAAANAVTSRHSPTGFTVDIEGDGR